MTEQQKQLLHLSSKIVLISLLVSLCINLILAILVFHLNTKANTEVPTIVGSYDLEKITEDMFQVISDDELNSINSWNIKQ